MRSDTFLRFSFFSSLPTLALITTATLPGQSLMEGSGPSGLVRIFNTDSAILEAKEPRKDLPCSVSQIKPQLGFDMKFHAGYEVSIPLKDLAGTDDLLTTIFRVTPENGKDEPVYFSQRISVPSIDPDAHGNAYLQGYFDLGEGKYSVDFLIRDRTERVCSFYWETDASLPGREKQLSLVIQPNTVAASDKEPFKEEPPVDRAASDSAGPLNVKVLVNFAPQNSKAATLQPLDMNALIAILRSIAREPRIGRFSIVAFNMQEQRVLYRQEASEQIDFPALGDALNSLKLGTVDLKRLSQKHGDTEFLSDLIAQEMKSARDKDRPDALIFAGPKVMLEENVPQDTLKEIGQVEFPIFYMNYTFNPQLNPWRDAIGTTVKFFKGSEFTISRPPDLWHAWTEIMSRIVKFRIGRRESGSASQ
jgi:hypothetical protein